MRNDNFPRNDHIDNNHLLNILLTMIARAEGNRLLKEMENDDPSL